MPLDVTTEIEIAHPPAVVASFASDPDNALAWCESIRAVEWKGPKPVATGSGVAFVARFRPPGRRGPRMTPPAQTRGPMTGSPAPLQATKPPIMSVAVARPRLWRVAAARLDV